MRLRVAATRPSPTLPPRFIELYRELTAENGAPTLGSQNQAVDFIRADPELRRAVAAWAETVEINRSGRERSNRA
jgi:hypothetical protein